MTMHAKTFWAAWRGGLLAMVLLVAAGAVQAQQRLKPFEMAASRSGDLDQVSAQVRQALTDAGFTVVGSYAPYTDAKFGEHQVVSARVIGVTSPALKQAAAQTEFGGYAAVQRVTVTSVERDGRTQVQVAYTNPVYMASAYRLKSDLADVGAALRKALGSQGAYGSEDGLTAHKLRTYHYKVFMPYFTDPDKLASYPDHARAVAAVQAGLAAHKGGTSQVYRVDIPGGKATLFGVALSGPADNTCSGDRHIMSRIDFAPEKSTGHLPYGMLVVGDTVYALPAKFRIAINFPDLSMMGSHSFFSIMCAPKSIKKALTAAAGGE
jgi:hypothetical protein